MFVFPKRQRREKPMGVINTTAFYIRVNTLHNATFMWTDCPKRICSLFDGLYTSVKISLYLLPNHWDARVVLLLAGFELEG